MEKVNNGSFSEAKVMEQVRRFIKSKKSCMKITSNTKIATSFGRCLTNDYAAFGHTEGEQFATYLVYLPSIPHINIECGSLTQNKKNIEDWIMNGESEIALIKYHGYCHASSAKVSMAYINKKWQDHLFARKKKLFFVMERDFCKQIEPEEVANNDDPSTYNENIVLSMMAELEKRVVALEKENKAKDERLERYDRFMGSLQNNITLYLATRKENNNE